MYACMCVCIHFVVHRYGMYEMRPQFLLSSLPLFFLTAYRHWDNMSSVGVLALQGSFNEHISSKFFALLLILPCMRFLYVWAGRRRISSSIWYFLLLHPCVEEEGECSIRLSLKIMPQKREKRRKEKKREGDRERETERQKRIWISPKNFSLSSFCLWFLF